jgi:hypothetical protein
MQRDGNCEYKQQNDGIVFIIAKPTLIDLGAKRILRKQRFCPLSARAGYARAGTDGIYSIHNWRSP